MSDLSSKSRTLGQILIVILGLLGLWLGSHLQFWLGLIMFLGAAACFVVLFRRDLRPTEQERRIGWKRAEAKGKFRFVARQVLLSELALLPLLAADLFNSYRNRELWNPRWLLTMCALMAGGSVLSSLVWWYFQERRYGNAP
jgi:drug/metabolite transporter (DMT)-like permease